MVERKLNVMIPVRDRINITQKCIESIRDRSGIFSKIQIHIYDNKSTLDNTNRMSIFQKLLEKEKIDFYSYDTNSSAHCCFGKAVAFKRWIQMMKLDKEIRTMKMEDEYKDYYLLIDNDFILGPRWDEFFISALDKIPSIHKETRFIIQSPGGVVQKLRDVGTLDTINNIFTNEEFDVLSCAGGGASGMWFMDYNMIKKLEWNTHYMATTHHINKKHDSTTWKKINNEIGHNVNYVAGIIIPDNLDPFAIHMSSSNYCSSICNKLTERTYDIYEEEFKRTDEIIKDITHQELYENHKNIGNRW